LAYNSYTYDKNSNVQVERKRNGTTITNASGATNRTGATRTVACAALGTLGHQIAAHSSVNRNAESFLRFRLKIRTERINGSKSCDQIKTSNPCPAPGKWDSAPTSQVP
jgi:hypothetical protein